MASWCYVCQRKLKRDYKWLAGKKVHPHCMSTAIKLFQAQLKRLPNTGEHDA